MDLVVSEVKLEKQNVAEALDALEKVKGFLRKKDYAEARALMKTTMKLFPDLDYGLNMLIVCEILYYGEMDFPSYGVDWYSLLHLHPLDSDKEVNTHCRSVAQLLVSLQEKKFPGVIETLNLVKKAVSLLLYDGGAQFAFNCRRSKSGLIDSPVSSRKEKSTFKQNYLDWKPTTFSTDVADHLHSHKRLTPSVCSSSNCEVEDDQSVLPELKKLRKHQVFREMPQQPHYHPLAKYGSKVQEGMMFGLDIAFTNLTEEIRRVEDAKSFWLKYQDFSKRLTVLEVMGYNVKKLWEQLKALEIEAQRDLVLQEKQVEFEVERKNELAKVANLQAHILKSEDDIKHSKLLVEKCNSKIDTLKKARLDVADAFALAAKRCVEVKFNLMESSGIVLFWLSNDLPIL